MAGGSANGRTPVPSAKRTTPHAHASVSRPSYGAPMMISGAAYSSEPQRVVSSGCAGSIKRERPKSVSFKRGIVSGGTGFSKGLDVTRISAQRD